MASGKQLMEQIYDQFLVCKICFETYKRPKTLICLHTFCVDCLMKHQDAQYERTYRYSIYNTTVNCPICRKRTDLPTGGVRRLPDNFLVANLADVVTRRRPYAKFQECEICKADSSSPQRQAINKCLDCCKLLCKKCVDMHRKVKVTKGHSLLDIEIEREVECKQHPDEIVRFYCEPCTQCICVVCTFHDHKGHDVTSFQEGLQKYQVSLDKLVDTCRERIHHVKEQIGAISKCENDIKNAEDDIRDMAIDSISDIRHKEREMVKCIYEIYGTDAIAYLKEKQPLQEKLETLQNTCNLTDVVTRDKNVELLLLKNEIEDKINKLLEKEIDLPPESLRKQVKFVPGRIDFGQLSVAGEIDDSLPSIQISVPSDNIVQCDNSGNESDKSNTETAEEQGKGSSNNHITQIATTVKSFKEEPPQKVTESKVTQTCVVTVQNIGTDPISARAPAIRSRSTMTNNPVLPELTTHLSNQSHHSYSIESVNTKQGQDTRYQTIENYNNANTSLSPIKRFSHDSNDNSSQSSNEGHIRPIHKDISTDTLGLIVLQNESTITPLCYIKTTSGQTMTEDIGQADASIETDHLAMYNMLDPRHVTDQQSKGIETDPMTSSDFGTSANVASKDRNYLKGQPSTTSTGFGDNDVRYHEKSIGTPWKVQLSQTNDSDNFAMNGQNSLIVNGSASAGNISGTDVNPDVGSEECGPVAKKLRVDSSLIQTDITLYDMDHMWKMLDRKMCNISTNTDVNVVVREIIPMSTASCMTDIKGMDTTLKVCKETIDATTTMNADVVKELDTDLYGPVSDKERKTQQQMKSEMRIDLIDASTSTNHSVHVNDQDSSTDLRKYVDSATDSYAPVMKDKRTSTFIERRHVAIMKRPHYISRGVITLKTETSDQNTSTDAISRSHVMCSTDPPSTCESACDPIFGSSMNYEQKTMYASNQSLQSDSTCSDDSFDDAYEDIDNNELSSNSAKFVDRQSSPMSTLMCSQCIQVQALSQERSMETMPVTTRDTFTAMPHKQYTNRKSSPVREFLPTVNQSVSTGHVTYESRAASPIHGIQRTRGTMTNAENSRNRGSNPIHIPGDDKEVSVQPTVHEQSTETRSIPMTETGIVTEKVTCDSKKTMTPVKYYTEKCTSTVRVLSMNKMIGTETTKSKDGFTMTTDVTSAYNKVTEPKPVRTCSRGTSTTYVELVTKETSPDRPFSIDRASSPVQVLHSDSSMRSAKLHMIEALETFQSVGMISLPFRPIADNPTSELTVIAEQSDEGSSTQSSPKPMFGRRAFSEYELRQRYCATCGTVTNTAIPSSKSTQSPTSSSKDEEKDFHSEQQCVCPEAPTHACGQCVELMTKCKCADEKCGGSNNDDDKNLVINNHTRDREDEIKTASHSQSVDVNSSTEYLSGSEGIKKEYPKEYPKAFLLAKLRADTDLKLKSQSTDKIYPSFLTPQSSRRNKVATPVAESLDDVTNKHGHRTPLARKKRPPMIELLGRSSSLPENKMPPTPSAESDELPQNKPYTKTDSKISQSEMSLKVRHKISDFKKKYTAKPTPKTDSCATFPHPNKTSSKPPRPAAKDRISDSESSTDMSQNGDNNVFRKLPRVQTNLTPVKQRITKGGMGRALLKNSAAEIRCASSESLSSN